MVEVFVASVIVNDENIGDYLLIIENDSEVWRKIHWKLEQV